MSTGEGSIAGFVAGVCIFTICTLIAVYVLLVGPDQTTPTAGERGPVAVGAKAAAPGKAPGKASSKPAPARKIDPRRGGFEITLGEWAVTPEAKAIRPGRVTFVIHNRGTMAHGFEIELEGDSSGPGSGDLFKAESELVQPGESTRMTVELGPAVYKIECLVDGHDDMGMEGLLPVRRDAPLVRQQTKAAPDVVAIEDFAFAPDVIQVERGTEVTWTNEDPTAHTVTAFDGSFGSDTLDAGATFAHRFATTGVYRYRCAIHPDMQGRIEVR